MKIRQLRETDIDEVARIMSSTELWQRYGVDFESARKRFKQALRGKAHMFVAEIEGKVAGFLWYVPRGAFDRSGYIELIGIKNTYRGRGIGKALMEFVEKEFNPDDIFLLVSDFNKEAQKFYEKLGFVKIGEIKDYVVKGITEFIYHKKRSER